MRTITRVSKAMQAVLVDRANELAIETGFMERERILTGSSFVTGLVSGWQANPQSSLAGLSQAIGNAGTPISRQAVAYRFDEKSVVFMKAVLGASLKEAVKAMPVSKGILSRFTRVELVDSSIIILPNDLEDKFQGSGGFGENARVSSLKLNVCLDVRSGELKTLDISSGIQHDRSSPAHHQLGGAGSLRIADLGYFKLDDFEAIDEDDGYWLSRYKQGTVVCDLNDEPLCLDTWLPQQIGQQIDCEILLGKSKRLRCRLVAERAPISVVCQRQQRLREEARQNQRDVSQRALAMAHWTIYVTNVPTELLATQEVFVLGRYRWQIELLFKLWKSDLQVDKWNTNNLHRILCELYAKLIGAIVTHWLLLVACWHNPQRSLRQAIPTIRGLAWQFANSLSSLALLRHAFQCLCRSLSKCNMATSRSDPRAYQLIYEDFA